MDLWTLIDRSYSPGNNKVAQELVAACKKCGVTTAEQLGNPSVISGARLAESGASEKALDLAVALILLRGVSYNHLLRPAA